MPEAALTIWYMTGDIAQLFAHRVLIRMLLRAVIPWQ